jgi:hypothetical protein
MRRCLEDAVTHGAEIKGNDQLDEDEQEENLCPCITDVPEVMIEEKEEEANFN